MGLIIPFLHYIYRITLPYSFEHIYYNLNLTYPFSLILDNIHPHLTINRTTQLLHYYKSIKQLIYIYIFRCIHIKLLFYFLYSYLPAYSNDIILTFITTLPCAQVTFILYKEIITTIL